MSRHRRRCNPGRWRAASPRPRPRLRPRGGGAPPPGPGGQQEGEDSLGQRPDQARLHLRGRLLGPLGPSRAAGIGCTSSWRADGSVLWAGQGGGARPRRRRLRRRHSGAFGGGIRPGGGRPLHPQAPHPWPRLRQPSCSRREHLLSHPRLPQDRREGEPPLSPSPPPSSPPICSLS